MKRKNINLAPVTPYNRCLKRLLQFANSRGIDVNTNSRTFSYIEDDHLINLSNKCAGQYKYICYFLHELGHATQPDSVFHKLKYKTHTINKLIILEQEYTAWVYGYRIAKRLNIDKYIKDIYIKEWSSAWHSYMMYLNRTNKTHIKYLATHGYGPKGHDPI